MSYDRNRHYNDLPLLPPSAELETPAVLKKTIAASRELAELKGAGNVIPNQAILVNSIVLQEARSSSEIENIVTTNDELYQALSDNSFAAPHAKEVLRYREALWHGFKLLKSRPLSVNLFVELVRAIKLIDMGIRKVPGTKIAREDGKAVYTPPEGESVLRDKLANLERFIHADDGLDPLVKLAVMHYQFEAIHPFTDGNGRTGRIINILFLVEKGLLEIPVLYLSDYIIRNKAAYYDGLRRVTEEGDWQTWILYLLDAMQNTARQTREKIFRIRDLMEETRQRVREQAPKAYSKDLIEVIFQHPYCKIGFIEDAGIARRQTASNYLKELETIGLLQSLKAGREKYYVNERLLAVLREETDPPADPAGKLL
ncbi:MAG: Fic family protein [Gammaproteobacteria bacterium]|nr:Fic family protein [Gammaproteobacteria bacterium]